MNELNCGICNTSFKKLYYNSKYCSKKCSETAKKNSIKKYHQSEEVKKRKNEYYKKWIKTKKGKESIKSRGYLKINDPEKYKKLLENDRKRLKSLNTRNIKDENGNLLTNYQVKKLRKNKIR
jgi:Cft2 family RNA processing exonuclease